MLPQVQGIQLQSFENCAVVNFALMVVVLILMSVSFFYSYSEFCVLSKKIPLFSSLNRN